MTMESSQEEPCWICLSDDVDESTGQARLPRVTRPSRQGAARPRRAASLVQSDAPELGGIAP